MGVSISALTRMTHGAFRWSRVAQRPARIPDTIPVGFDPTRPLAFIHVPKTAGTALAAGLSAALQPVPVCTGFDRVLFDGFSDFSSLHDMVRQKIWLSPASMPADAKLVMGHFSVSGILDRYPSAQLLTILREPFSRLLSHWLYWRRMGDAALVPWGNWADRLRLSRLPLSAFLNARDIACHVDNLVLRMLLWPHPLIPADDFIDLAHDEQLIGAAGKRLQRFSYVDVVENAGFQHGLAHWLGRSFACGQLNETGRIPTELRAALHSELTPDAFALLSSRSRLDLRLWTDVVRHRMPGCDPAELRQRVLLRNVARYAVLLN